MGKKGLTLFLLFFLLGAESHGRLCRSVFLDRAALTVRDVTVESFLSERDSLMKSFAEFKEVRELNREIEAQKAKGGSSARATREARANRIHQMRFMMRTGDVELILESTRFLFDQAKGAAKTIHEARVLHVKLDILLERQMISKREYTEYRELLEQVIREEGEALGRIYADYSVAEMVIGELKDAGEILANGRLTLRQFEELLKGDRKIEDPELAEVFAESQRQVEQANHLFERLQGRLPINSIQANLFPHLAETNLKVDRAFVRAVYEGLPIEGYAVYGREIPFLATLRKDLKAEQDRSRFLWLSEMTGWLWDKIIMSVNLVPGSGHRWNAIPEGFARDPQTQQATSQVRIPDSSDWGGFVGRIGQGFNNLGGGTRYLLYYFAKAYIDKRAIQIHIPSIETLKKIHDFRGKDAFFLGTIDAAGKHGQLNFFITFARIPFYHKMFLQFKQQLMTEVARGKENPAARSRLYERTLRNLLAAEVRADQLETVNIVFRDGRIRQHIQNISLILGTAGVSVGSLWAAHDYIVRVTKTEGVLPPLVDILSRF